jgi:hypothetical protein
MFTRGRGGHVWLGVALVLALVVIAGRTTFSQQAIVMPPTTDGVVARAIDTSGVTLPPADETANERRFSFIAYGDTRGPADGDILQPQHSDVVDGMLATIRAQRDTAFPVRFVVQSGDAVVSGRFGRQWNTSFTPIIERLVREGRVPYFFSVGNHDVGTVPSVTDVSRTIGLRNSTAAMAGFWPADGSPQRLAGYPTFWFAYGQVFVIVIDSNIAIDQAQLQWVTSQLQQVDRGRFRHIVAVFHHPALTSGFHGGATVEPQTDAIRRLYMPLFRQHHVRLLLTGHDHLYDHYVERYDDASGPHRIDHIVTGGGGAPIYRYTSEPDLSRYVQSALPQAVRVEHIARPGPTESDNPHHFVLVQVDGDLFSLRVIPTTAAPFTPYNGSDSISLGSEGPPAPTGR